MWNNASLLKAIGSAQFFVFGFTMQPLVFSKSSCSGVTLVDIAVGVGGGSLHVQRGKTTGGLGYGLFPKEKGTKPPPPENLSNYECKIASFEAILRLTIFKTLNLYFCWIYHPLGLRPAPISFILLSIVYIIYTGGLTSIFT